MFPADPLRICRKCDAPPHPENCEECLGFGKRPNGSPVGAGLRDSENAVRCLLCGGHPSGWVKPEVVEVAA